MSPLTSLLFILRVAHAQSGSRRAYDSDPKATDKVTVVSYLLTSVSLSNLMATK